MLLSEFITALDTLEEFRFIDINALLFLRIFTLPRWA